MRIRIFGTGFPEGIGSTLEITSAKTIEEMLNETIWLFKSDLDTGKQHYEPIITHRVWGHIFTEGGQKRMMICEEYVKRTYGGSEQYHRNDYYGKEC